MALNIEALCADTMLDLVKTKPLKKITVKDLLAATGLSKQTFYNHFKDRDDLIHNIYLDRIITLWQDPTATFDYYSSVLDTNKRIAAHHHFMKQAVMMTGQNCLQNFMRDYCIEFDLQWHKNYYGETEMSPELVFATTYHAIASINMTISWILLDMPSSPETFAESLAMIRHAGLSGLFYSSDKKISPYEPIE